MKKNKLFHEYIYTISWELREGYGEHEQPIGMIEGKRVSDYPKDSFEFINQGHIYWANKSKEDKRT